MIGLGALGAAQQAAVTADVGGGSGDDPYWQGVGFYLPMDTDFADETGKTWSVNGAVIASGEAVFDGTNDYVRHSASADFAFGRSDFTMEGYFAEASTTPSTQCFLDMRVGSGTYALAVYNRTSAGSAGIALYGQAGLIGSSATVFSSILQHWAVVRDGGTLRFYLNGVQLFAVTGTEATRLFGGPGVTIGANYLAPAASQWSNGRHQHLRITRGVCRYPSGTPFTPPSVPFDTAGGTAPGSGPGAHRYWRLLITDNDGHASFFGFTELVMRDRDLVQVSGYNSAPSAISASSSVNGSNASYLAFDGNLTSSGWLSANKTPDQWIKNDFHSSESLACSVEIREIDIYGSHNAPTASPRDFKLQWSDDNSSWTDALSVTGETGWSANEKRTFVVF